MKKKALIIFLVILSITIAYEIIKSPPISTPIKAIVPDYSKVQKIYNNYTDTLMKAGLLQKVQQEGDHLIVYYVKSNLWSKIPYTEKVNIVKALSLLQNKSRYTSYLEIKDYYSGKLLAEIKPLTNKVYE